MQCNHLDGATEELRNACQILKICPVCMLKSKQTEYRESFETISRQGELVDSILSKLLDSKLKNEVRKLKDVNLNDDLNEDLLKNILSNIGNYCSEYDIEFGMSSNLVSLLLALKETLNDHLYGE